ncbi:hypothetical protein scyTo_0025672, partial [Scyliorhinus torazame]|nr:hypothetical protein [Scyliorhinus torazame]
MSGVLVSRMILLFLYFPSLIAGCVEEDGEVLFGSLQEILKAAVMVDADVITETFELLMQTAKDYGSSLPGLVPDGLYLPAPPLYCPQPAIDSE